MQCTTTRGSDGAGARPGGGRDRGRRPAGPARWVRRPGPALGWRLSRLRGVIARIAALFAVLLVGGAAAAAPAAALGLPGRAGAPAAVLPAGKNLSSLEIYDAADGTGILNRAKVKAAVDEISFHEPTKVVVFTRDGLSSDNINTKTLLWARASHPELISSKDSDKWADGLFIVTLSVESDGHGQIGTYFGEDRRVSTGSDEIDVQRKIQAAGTTSFKAARWTDGVVEVIRAAAAKMNAPWYTSPALWWTVGIGGGAAGIGAAAYAAVRANNRGRTAAAINAGKASLTRVTMDLDNTEISARALPASGSKHAADLEARFAAFMTKYRSLIGEQDSLESLGKKQTSTSEVRNRAEAFASSADELDAVDDTIAAAAALYARTEGWHAAWRLQVQPLEEDLAGVPAIVQEGANMNFGFFGSREREGIMASATASLDAWLPTATARVQELNTAMEAGTMEVDAALDRLAALRGELSQQLQSFASAQISAYAKTERERETMQEQMDDAQTSSRRNRGSILDLTTPRIFWSSFGYSRGYSSGVSSVQSSRSSSSSSGGSTTGYSGGGGSFSGSGSSSRF